MTEIGGNIVKAVVSAARKITGREPHKTTAKKATAKKATTKKTTAKKATAKKATAKKSARSPAAPQPSTTEVRAWARTVGLPVPDRGRLRPEIWQAWHDTNGPN